MQFWPESLGSMLEYWLIKLGLLVVVLRFPRVSWNLLWLVQYQINLLESNPNVHGFLSCTVIKKKAIALILNQLFKFLSPQIPVRDHSWYNLGIISGPGIICGTFGDHLRNRNHLLAGIICGAVQNFHFVFFYKTICPVLSMGVFKLWSAIPSANR